MQFTGQNKVILLLAISYNAGRLKRYSVKRIKKAKQFAQKYPNLRNQMDKSIKDSQKKIIVAKWLMALAHKIDKNVNLPNDDPLVLWIQLYSATPYLFKLHKNNQPLLNNLWKLVQAKKQYSLNHNLVRLVHQCNSNNINTTVQQFLMWGKIRERRKGIFKWYVIHRLHLLPLTDLQEHYQEKISHNQNVQKYAKALKVLQRLQKQHVEYFYHGVLRITPLHVNQLQQIILQCAESCAVAKDLMKTK